MVPLDELLFSRKTRPLLLLLMSENTVGVETVVVERETKMGWKKSAADGCRWIVCGSPLELNKSDIEVTNIGK